MASKPPEPVPGAPPAPSEGIAQSTSELLYPDDAPVAEEERSEEPSKEGEQPAPYNLRAPEGFAIDQELLTAATPVLREIGLNDEQANKLLPLVPQLEARVIESLDDELSVLKKEWASQVRADPRLGGANWRETERYLTVALDAAGAGQGSEFRELMDDSGLGNHPAIIRGFRAIGERLSRAGLAAKTPQDRLTALYPDDVP